MACEIVSTRGAVFTLWGTPNPRDIDRVKQALESAAEECGHPVVYITRVPVNAPAPDAATRARLDELMPSLVQSFSTYHVVLEGEGFAAAFKRGILVGLFQLSWRRKTFFVHANVHEVALNVGRECEAAVRAVLHLARIKDLLTAPPPVSVFPPKPGSTRAA